MKVTLDLSKLLEEGKINRAEFEKLSQLSAESTGMLIYNIIMGLGVIAVSAATLVLSPSAITAIIIGTIIGTVGMLMVHAYIFKGIFGDEFVVAQWAIFANICLLVGSLLIGGGIITYAEGADWSYLIVASFFAALGIALNNKMLIVIAVLALSSSLNFNFLKGFVPHVKGDYLKMGQPFAMIIVFTFLWLGIFYLSHYIKTSYKGLARSASLTSLFLINLAFWVGSARGDKMKYFGTTIPRWFFIVTWAIALSVVGLWALKSKKRWVVNAVAVLGAIHFYTQWFNGPDRTPKKLLIGGLIAIAFALFMRNINRKMSKTSSYKDIF